MPETVIQNVRFDENGLIPAVVQDVSTGEVLALEYMDNNSLLATLKTGETFFPRKTVSNAAEGAGRNRLVDVRLNTDGGLLTILVERDPAPVKSDNQVSLMRDIGAALRPNASDVSLVNVDTMEFGLALNSLYSLIAERKEKRPEGSYTTYLFNSGLDKILKKIAEEGGEVIIASKNKSARDLISELADLFYHLLVLMVEREIKLSDVHNELSRRANASSAVRDDADQAARAPQRTPQRTPQQTP
jgi:phosphoribosyl-ATP pyrophosphohydrolase/phosphoribosyl-AMP cyclohydrolase